MNVFVTVGILYVAWIVSTLIHEFGHQGKMRFFSFFPIPVAASLDAKYRYGGLVMDALVVLGVYFFRPEILFVQAVGFFSFVSLALYLTYGSFNRETRFMGRALTITDDVDNGDWMFTLPLGLFFIYYFGAFFSDIIINIFRSGFM